MDPVTLLTVASSAMGAMGAIQQGKAAQAQANFDAQMAERNAKISQNQALAEGQATAQRESKQRREARAFMGKQAAAFGSTGTAMSGSALQLTEESATAAELDALNIRYEGTLKQQGLLADAVTQQYQAKGMRVAGENAKKASYLSAGSQLLSGATSYAKYKAGV